SPNLLHATSQINRLRWRGGIGGVLPNGYDNDLPFAIFAFCFINERLDLAMGWRVGSVEGETGDAAARCSGKWCPELSRFTQNRRSLAKNQRFLGKKHRSLGKKHRSLEKKHRSLEKKHRSLGKKHRSLGKIRSVLRK